MKDIIRTSCTVGFCLSLLGACQEAEVVEWIEVPLSDATFYSAARAFHEGDYSILVLRESALEFKLEMNAGDSIVYNWTVDMDEPQLLGAEFHGHTNRVGEEPGTVMFYKIHTDGKESGTMIAPFDGIHGWYLDNKSNKDISVKLHVAGYYNEIE